MATLLIVPVYSYQAYVLVPQQGQLCGRMLFWWDVQRPYLTEQFNTLIRKCPAQFRVYRESSPKNHPQPVGLTFFRRTKNEMLSRMLMLLSFI